MGEWGVRRFAYIDALRGYAILSVITAHVALAVFPSDAIGQRLMQSGARGVQLFFVTSAIALMFAWHSHANGTAAFFIRRLFRIAPMLWLAIPATFAVSAAIDPSSVATWDQIAATALFLHGLTPQWINTAVAGSWTIAVEATFYLLFPLIVVSVTSLRRAAVGLAVSFAVAAAGWLFLLSYAQGLGAEPSNWASFAFTSFAVQSPCFMIGVGTYFLIIRSDISDRMAMFAGIAALLLIGAMCAVTRSSAAYIGFAFAFGALAVAFSHNRLRMLVNRPICALGLISYSAYFWHFLVLKVLSHFTSTWSFWALFAAVLPVTIALSAATTHMPAS
jgi:peptidoglycan/LPS O-acetylase OafA/YrhL